MPEERWLPIPGHDGYEVSNLGRVMSYKRAKPHEMRGGRNQRGYRMVGFTVDGVPVTRTVHRLVAEAFIGPLPEGMETRHIDGDKNNNAANNLEYCTQSVNTLDMVRHGVHNMARKTHCPENHPYNEANTRHYRGRRHCRTCARARQRAWYERQMLAAANVSELAA